MIENFYYYDTRLQKNKKKKQNCEYATGIEQVIIRGEYIFFVIGIGMRIIYSDIIQSFFVVFSTRRPVNC